MAIVSVILAGVCGFSAFLISWMFFGTGLVGGLAVYAVVAFVVAASLLAIGAVREARKMAAARKAHELAIRAWETDTVTERMAAEDTRDTHEDPEKDSRVA
ncbi:hypothetical protein AB1M95_01840 [Sulfitobacter sp. LCG007]